MNPKRMRVERGTISESTHIADLTVAQLRSALKKRGIAHAKIKLKLTLVELLNDVSFRIAPLTDLDVADMLEEVKGTALLRGYRGARTGDEAALREILSRISALVESCPEVLELDLNPVKVLGTGARAVDFRVRVGRPPSPPGSRRVSY